MDANLHKAILGKGMQICVYEELHLSNGGGKMIQTEETVYANLHPLVWGSGICL